MAPTALVVDDEPMVRHLVRRILEPDVCAVLDAEDGETALRLIQRRREAIDVVLTDLVMPGLDGFDVVDVLARHHPELPVACMSGYVSQLSGIRSLSVPFIPKPFTTEILRGLMVPLIERSRAIRASAVSEQGHAGQQRAGSQDLRGRGAMELGEAVDLVAAARALRESRAKPPPHG
jgi:DNA-binding NtrC family response regulator